MSYAEYNQSLIPIYCHRLHYCMMLLVHNHHQNHVLAQQWMHFAFSLDFDIHRAISFKVPLLVTTPTLCIFFFTRDFDLYFDLLFPVG
uniref:Putative ovule protein n=1 Tax=Solanum chacoense TaxID=4108 RepID=A0A0V0HN49_SOLCH